MQPRGNSNGHKLCLLNISLVCKLFIVFSWNRCNAFRAKYFVVKTLDKIIIKKSCIEFETTAFKVFEKA